MLVHHSSNLISYSDSTMDERGERLIMGEPLGSGSGNSCRAARRIRDE